MTLSLTDTVQCCGCLVAQGASAADRHGAASCLRFTIFEHPWIGVAPSMIDPKEVGHVKFDWHLVGLLLLALLVRLATIIAFPSLHHPDENFQLFEQGHRWFFGYGLVPWEFRVGTRSPVMPFLLGLTFAAAEPVVGGPEGYLLIAKLLLALSSLAGVVAVYRMGSADQSHSRISRRACHSDLV
jgi:Alg9-like mannosyltransferase family